MYHGTRRYTRRDDIISQDGRALLERNKEFRARVEQNYFPTAVMARSRNMAISGMLFIALAAKTFFSAGLNCITRCAVSGKGNYTLPGRSENHKSPG